ncbi:unnamed protein product [Adineta steineri]|uniref:Uncharacterized protein n=1 Tax=Adineta steineri TaxID=433720 RepID=A0A813S5Y4_9BILA|nr:unnamed protein product [Adineta steineri]CAF1205859.1 unnamed protein product [Adineta steineri]
MSAFNDDGIPLNLTTVLTLFLMPNLFLIILTIFSAYLLHLSKTNPYLNYLLGRLAKFFTKGVLDRIIICISQDVQARKKGHNEQIYMTRESSVGTSNDSTTIDKVYSTCSSNSMPRKRYDPNYLLLVPFQIDLLLTVFVYKILTREVYPETCATYLTTYHTRPNQVVCWLKNINKSISNLAIERNLSDYCFNQLPTTINYEHNDVICTQFVFKLLNIIDTVTNIFAWHQAIVFVVVKAIVFSHWYQKKVRQTCFWSSPFTYQRRIIVSIIICLMLSIYISVFVFIFPIRFILKERRRVDLTHHLLYASSKFVVAMIIHVNLYTFYQWNLFKKQKKQILILKKNKNSPNEQSKSSNVSKKNGYHASAN